MMAVEDKMSYANDIPFSLAQAAHAGTSFVPEKRAEQERSGYAATLEADFAALSRYANTDEKKVQLEEEFARYRAGYRRRFIAYLGSRGAVVSWMIAGPSNFPSSRMRKRSDAADKRSQDLQDFRERALDAIRKTLCPELRPIMSGDEDAPERLAAKIAKLKKNQETMKACNLCIRKHAKAGADAQVKALVCDLGLSEKQARQLLEPSCFGDIGFARYQLTNNGANIRRLEQRLEAISKAKATPDSELQGKDARLEVSAKDNRIRLYFADKPSAEVRTRLKGAGFRWAPRDLAWSAYINHNALTVAKRVAGTVVASHYASCDYFACGGCGPQVSLEAPASLEEVASV